MLVAAVLFIDSVLLLFLQVSLSGVILLPHVQVVCAWLVQVAQGLVRFRKLKFIGLNVRRGLP